VNMQVHNHTADCTGQNGFLGRVVLPQIRAGQPVDQWFVLQTLEVLHCALTLLPACGWTGSLHTDS